MRARVKPEPPPVTLLAECSRLVGQAGGLAYFASLGLPTVLPSENFDGWVVRCLAPVGLRPDRRTVAGEPVWEVAASARTVGYVLLASVALERLGLPPPEELAAAAALVLSSGSGVTDLDRLIGRAS